MALEITLAGEVAIRGAGGQHHTLSRARSRVAFALLTLERSRGVSREVLADAVWPAGVPKTWDSALRNVVTEVRAFVTQARPGGPDPVLASTGRYRLVLPDDVLVDVELAEATIAAAQKAQVAGDHQRALAQARMGTDVLRLPFLSDHDAEWVVQQQYRFGQLLLVGLEALSQAAAALGDGPTALAAADEAITREPLRESAHRCRMAAHAVAGNRAEALKAYQHLRRELAEAYGADPSPETEEAYLALLGAPPSAAAGAGTGAGPGAGRRPGRPPSPALTTPPFVGRQRELAALDAAWNQTVTGRSCQVVLVTGDTGIGKTRLVREAAQQMMTGGGLVLFGRCDRDPTMPYQPFVEMLDGFVSAMPEDELPRLDGLARAQLAAVFPSFDAPPAPTSAPDRAGLFDAVVELLVAATSDRPVAVVLDDLQWADADTLLLLRHVLRRTASVPLLAVVVARDPAELAPPLSDAVHGAERDRRLHRLALDGLSEPEVRELVERLRPERGTNRGPAQLVHLARRLLADTAGNPFMLVELLQGEADLAWGGEVVPAAPVPAGVQELVEDKLAALDQAGRDLLRTASVAGTTFELDLVAAATGLDEGLALDALDAALAARLVTEAGAGTHPGPGAGGADGGAGASPPYSFTHEIVQRTLYDQISGPRRRQLHTRLADAVEAHRPGHLDDYTPVLAHHRHAAAAPEGDLAAVRWARAAARQAGERRAAAQVLRLLRQALRHVPGDDPGLRAEVLVELGLAQVDANDPHGEQTLLDAAVQARRSGRLDVAARAALGVADLAQAAGSALHEELRAEAATLVKDVLEEIDAFEPTPATGAAGAGGAAGDRPGASTGSTSATGGPLGPVDPLVHARLIARHLQLRNGAGAAAPATEPAAKPAPTWAQALDVLCTHLGTLGGPVNLDDRLARAGDLDALARAVGDPEHQTIAAHHRAMVEATMSGTSRFAPAAGLQPANGTRRATCALVEQEVAVAVTQGRFADAWAAGERLVAEKGEASRWWAERGVLPSPGTVAAPQLLVAGWLEAPLDDAAQARREHVLGALRGGAADMDVDGDPSEQSLLALVRGDRGRARLVARAAAQEPESLPGGDRWLHSMGVLALVAVELRDPAIAGAAYELLAPHAGLACGVGYRSFVGTVTFHLGRLAAVTGDHADAERQLVAALQQHSDSGARPWIALTQHALADALQARGRAYDRDWVRVLRGESSSLAQALGLRLPPP